MKATVEERKRMQRTQPKKVRVIDGLKGGKGKMITVEPSEVEKERQAKEST